MYFAALPHLHGPPPPPPKAQIQILRVPVSEKINYNYNIPVHHCSSILLYSTQSSKFNLETFL